MVLYESYCRTLSSTEVSHILVTLTKNNVKTVVEVVCYMFIIQLDLYNLIALSINIIEVSL